MEAIPKSESLVNKSHDTSDYDYIVCDECARTCVHTFYNGIQSGMVGVRPQLLSVRAEPLALGDARRLLRGRQVGTGDHASAVRAMRARRRRRRRLRREVGVVAVARVAHVAHRPGVEGEHAIRVRGLSAGQFDGVAMVVYQDGAPFCRHAAHWAGSNP